MRLIDADALKETVANTMAKTIIYSINEGVDVLKMIDATPTIDAEPVRYGRWVRSPNGLYTCSECGVNDLFGLSSNCPNCRAKMYGGATDD
jgi:hypothetical protein